MPISKLLVANRSEIAIRVFRAANELGLKTVAIWAEEDKYSLHRFKADESYQVGRGPHLAKDMGPIESYLSIERVLSFYTATIDDRDEIDRLRALARSLNRDVQALEVHADFLGARLQMTVDATLGLINLQQNNTVRVLSVVAALFLPPTMIASIYGMNFDQMPELHRLWGYPAALAAMVASAAGIYLLAKWKKWL